MEVDILLLNISSTNRIYLKILQLYTRGGRNWIHVGFVIEQIDLTFTSNLSNRTSIKVLLFRIHLFGCNTLHDSVNAPKHPDITPEGYCLWRMRLHEHIIIYFNVDVSRMIRNRFAVGRENFESSFCLVMRTLNSENSHT